MYKPFEKKEVVVPGSRTKREEGERAAVKRGKKKKRGEVAGWRWAKGREQQDKEGGERERGYPVAGREPWAALGERAGAGSPEP